MKRHSWRTLIALATATPLMLGGVAAAHAVPTPDGGPDSGGTTVTVTAPAFSLVQLSTGTFNVVAIGDDGNTYAWGYNDNGELGNGTTTDALAPGLVSTPSGVTFTQVSTGPNSSVALGDDGNTYAWGRNLDGELGNGTTTGALTPGLVSTPTGVTFTQISAGQSYALALGDDGNTYAWGRNVDGELGNGTTTGALTPGIVSTPSGVTFTQISAGPNYALAVGDDGNTYAWGYNDNGELGNGTTTGALTPGIVSTPSGVTFTQISAAPNSALAIGDDGNTYAWGRNLDGQLGNGTTTGALTPGLVATPSGVTFTQVSAGPNYALAVGDDGNTYSWGYNGHGELGDGSTTGRTTPVLVLTEVVVTDVSFGGTSGTSLTDNGNGTSNVITPAHAAGVVDVVIEWTLNGVAQTPITHAGGFTYYGEVALGITDPADTTVDSGQTATFSVTTTGLPEPTITWETSTDAGTTWNPTTTGVSSDGLTLNITTTTSDDGNQYRATATNSQGTTTSSAATLTVIPVSIDIDHESDITPVIDKELAITGNSATPMFAALGVLSLLLGGGLITINMMARRRMA